MAGAALVDQGQLPSCVGDLDVVGGVAVRALGRAGISLAEGGRVYACLVDVADSFVASSASLGDVVAIDPALVVGGTTDFVVAMAGGAVGGHEQAAFVQRAAVDAVLEVGRNVTNRDVGLGDDGRVGVALAACGEDVEVVGLGLGILWNCGCRGCRGSRCTRPRRCH